MLFKIDKSEIDSQRNTGSMNVTAGEHITLSFSEDGKSWTTFKMTGRILHKILVDAQEYLENINDPELKFTRLNGHSFLVERPKEGEE